MSDKTIARLLKQQTTTFFQCGVSQLFLNGLSNGSGQDQPIIYMTVVFRSQKDVNEHYAPLKEHLDQTFSGRVDLVASPWHGDDMDEILPNTAKLVFQSS